MLPSVIYTCILSHPSWKSPKRACISWREVNEKSAFQNIFDLFTVFKGTLWISIYLHNRNSDLDQIGMWLHSHVPTQAISKINLWYVTHLKHCIYGIVLCVFLFAHESSIFWTPDNDIPGSNQHKYFESQIIAWSH